jgi:hypothetical protein
VKIFGLLPGVGLGWREQGVGKRASKADAREQGCAGKAPARCAGKRRQGDGKVTAR